MLECKFNCLLNLQRWQGKTKDKKMISQFLF